MERTGMLRTAGAGNGVTMPAFKALSQVLTLLNDHFLEGNMAA
jgi:hypothetical protein